MLPARAIRRAELTAARAVLGALVRELGLLGAGRVLGRVTSDRARGEPFSRLGPPVDDRDRLSRRQLADLIVLDRAVRRRAGDAVADRVAREAVLSGGTRFLSLIMPELGGGEQLAHRASTLARQFFNAEGQTEAEGEHRFRFTVSRCRFVELLAATGAGHLAPLFCQVDRVYFDDPGQPIRLTRTQTLATGGSCCDFQFELSR